MDSPMEKKQERELSSQVSEKHREVSHTGQEAVRDDMSYLKDELFRTLMSRYRGLVYKTAYMITRGQFEGFELEDIVQQGKIGLLKAAITYEPNKGTQFKTWILKGIRHSMFEFMRDISKTRRSLKEAAKKLEALEEEVGQLSSQDIHQRLGWNYSKIVEVRSIDSLEYPMPLDCKRIFLSKEGETEISIEETIGSEMEFEPDYSVLYEKIDLLPERERLIIRLHYFEEMTIDASSKVLGISPSRGLQLIQQGRKRIAESCNEEDKYSLLAR